MHERPAISSFRPTDAWHDDWPYDVWTRVGVHASLSGPAATTAVQDFVEPLRRDPDADDPGGVRLYFRGGYTVEVTPPADGDAWQIVLASAGEDGFDSVQDAADDLVAALRSTPGEVRIAWSELAATRAGTHSRGNSAVKDPVRTTVVVDAANCVGSVPDGWWRDRVGATRRLRDSLEPEGLRHGLQLDATPALVMVVEGKARGVESTATVQVVDAPGIGDDTIVDLVDQLAARGESLVVVTADRELRSRVAALGARTVGPRVVRSR